MDRSNQQLQKLSRWLTTTESDQTYTLVFIQIAWGGGAWLDPTPRISASGGLGWAQESAFLNSPPGNTELMVQAAYLEEGLKTIWT